MKTTRQQLLAFVAVLLIYAAMVIPWGTQGVGAFSGSDIVRASSLPSSCTPGRTPAYLLTISPYGLYTCSATGIMVAAGNIGGVNGSSLQLLTATATINGAAAATISATNLIPAGSLLMGVTCRVTSTFSNTSLTSQNIGDGTTANLFGATVALTSGTTTTYANTLSTFSPKIYAAATSVVSTGVGANFAANGTLEIVIYYYALTAPTS